MNYILLARGTIVCTYSIGYASARSICPFWGSFRTFITERVQRRPARRVRETWGAGGGWTDGRRVNGREAGKRTGGGWTDGRRVKGREAGERTGGGWKDGRRVNGREAGERTGGGWTDGRRVNGREAGERTGGGWTDGRRVNGREAGERTGGGWTDGRRVNGREAGERTGGGWKDGRRVNGREAGERTGVGWTDGRRVNGREAGERTGGGWTHNGAASVTAWPPLPTFLAVPSICAAPFQSSRFINMQAVSGGPYAIEQTSVFYLSHKCFFFFFFSTRRDLTPSSRNDARGETGSARRRADTPESRAAPTRGGSPW